MRGAVLGAIGVPIFKWFKDVGVGEGASKSLGNISTDLGIHAGEKVRFRGRQFEMDLKIKTNEALNEVTDWIRLMERKLPKAEKQRVEAAILLRRPGLVAAAIQGNPELVAAYRKVQNVLADLNDQNVALGRYKKGLVDYFPTLVDGRKGLMGLKAAMDKTLRSELEEILMKAEGNSDKMNGRSLSDVEMSVVIDNWMQKKEGEARLPGHAKRRSVKMTPELMQYYKNPTDTLMQYLTTAIKDIETAKFFGAHLKSRKFGSKKATDINDSIGAADQLSGLKDGYDDSWRGSQEDCQGNPAHARFVPGGDQSPHVAIQTRYEI